MVVAMAWRGRVYLSILVQSTVSIYMMEEASFKCQHRKPSAKTIVVALKELGGIYF